MKNNSLHVLIIDEEQETVRVLLGILARKGIRATVFENRQEAVECLEKNRIDLMFTCIHTESSADTFRMIHEVRLNSPELPIVLMGSVNPSQGTQLQRVIDLAMNTAGLGCRRFLLKPLSSDKVENLLDSILPNQTVATIDEHIGQRGNRIVGRSPKMIQLVDLAKRIATTSMPVLVTGESGTGKELVSSLIHYNSHRANGPYLQVNCAALNDGLLESELFGHEKGAFTGAHTQRKGRFEMAHGGTLLLDEITETPLKFQATLLRVLEQQDFERVGGNDSVQVDVRIISTSNKDLLEEVAQGRFRQDLYYRLCGIRLFVPPLRERIEDLPELVWYFVNLYSRQIPRKIADLSGEMMDIFKKYDWPGNIRQLRNVVRTSLALGTGSTLSLADTSWLFNELQPRVQKESNVPEDNSSLIGMPLAEVERQVILETLDHTSGNQTKAAKILGISDRTLRGKIRQYRQQECPQLI